MRYTASEIHAKQFPIMSRNLDLIESGAWDAAFFTTFVLSLSFFEALYLRSLHKVQCKNIWVLADVVGYRKSLMEGRSSAVGHEYHLVPVALRSGIFHPKCIYLSSPEEDALLVGSGNLTFGGFGRNLEVMEIFNSNSSPEIFWDFAEFLKSMRLRSDLFRLGDILPTQCETSPGRIPVRPRASQRLSGWFASAFYETWRPSRWEP
jgi:hypothetical protein